MSVERAAKQAAANAPNDFGVQLLAGAGLLAHDDVDKAIPLLEKARAMFPEYGGDDSPYALLVGGVREEGRQARSRRTCCTKWTSLTETNSKALLALADLLEALGDAKGAADALDRAMFINPFDMAMHQRLALLARAAGDKPMRGARAGGDRRARAGGSRPTRCISSRWRSTTPATTCTRAPACCARSKMRRTTRRRRRCC